MLLESAASGSGAAAPRTAASRTAGTPAAVSDGRQADARGRHASTEFGEASAARTGFAGWYRSRPFVGGCVTILAGLEMFGSSQLDLGNIHIQVGIEGLQATILPILLVVLGTLAIFLPAQRIFYGVIALVAAVYSLVGVNLGGFFLGMLLGIVGGIMIVSWLPPERRRIRSREKVASQAFASGAE